MNYLGEDELTQVMGIGQLGEVRNGPDGHLYEWVQGIDGLGNPVGFWKKLRRRLRRLARKALPIARQFAPLIPGVGPAVAAGLTKINPLLRQAGVAGYDGIGALYQSPDGTMYQMQGLAEDEDLQGFAEYEDLRGLAEDELTQVMGIGQLGEVRPGPDGHLYEWVQGIDGLGNPIGFWKKLRRRLRRLARKVLPIARQFAPLIPGVGPKVAAGLTMINPLLRQAGVAGYDGIGALYQSPDGTVYQMQGLAEDEDLRGVAEYEDLRGLAEDEELRGYIRDPRLQGLAEDEDLRGLAEEEDLRGLEQWYPQQDAMNGFEQDYSQPESINGMEAFVPEQPPSTRWFSAPGQAPKMWEAPW
jgi:hypothetical protein